MENLCIVVPGVGPWNLKIRPGGRCVRRHPSCERTSFGTDDVCRHFITGLPPLSPSAQAIKEWMAEA